MKSYATLLNLATSLSQNLTSSNQALAQQLEGDAHRDLIQKFFDNERSFQTTTVGGQSLTTTATLALGAVTATLTASWTYPTGNQQVNFSNGDQRSVLFTNGSTAISWVGGLSSTATTAISSVGMQDYIIPAVISKVTNDTINVGQLKFQPAPVQTRQDWDSLNFLPYTSDIVNYFFIYNGRLSFFPIPSTTGNLITFNYKARVPDFSNAFIFSDANGTAFVAGQTAFDYQKGTISTAAVGSTSITGVSTAWNTTGKYPLNTDVSFYNLYLIINPPYGDGIYYPISQFNSDTSLTLAAPIVNAPNIASATYSIGQFPVLSEDFHDMIVFSYLRTYFSSIVESETKFKLFDAKYKEKFTALEDYAGTKSIQVDLGATPELENPNLFLYANS